MKKLYVIWAVSLLTGFSAEAQLVAKQIIRKNTGSAKPAAMHPGSAARTRPASNQIATAFWSDDFANPASWTISHEPGTTDDWVIGTSGPSGLYFIATIQSASAANGFALFDSDLMCSHNEIGNLTTANAIDCSTHPNVRLTFSQYYRRYFDSTYVFISNDGTNWVRFPVNGAILNNGYSSGNSAINPSIVNIDISSVAASQATVYVRFQYYSPTALGASAGCGYSWQIDDVSLSEVPATDASILLPAYPDNYSLLPIAQVNGFGMKTHLVNAGGTAITNTSVLFDVFQDNLGNNVFSGASNPVASINPGDTSIDMIPTSLYYPTDTGIYIIRYIASVTGDQDGSNDTAFTFVYVGDSTYARDYSAIDANDYVGSYGFNSQTGSFGIAYHVFQASQFTSATFYLGGVSIGDHLSVDVLGFNAGSVGALLGTTGSYTATAADTGGALITLPFQSPVNVGAGDYLVALNQLDTNNIGLGASSGIFANTSIYFSVAGGAWNSVESAGLPLTFLIRVNNPSSTIVGIDAPEKSSGFSIFPNPSKGLITILNDGSGGKDVDVNVMDALGKVVMTRHFSSLMNEKIDLRSQPEGIYTIQIRSTSGVTTKTLVVSAK